MSASDKTAVAFIYKRVYSDDQVGDQTMREHPLLAMSAKKRGMGGEDFRYIVKSGTPQGVSSSFTTAQNGAASSKGKQFATEPVEKYGIITIDGPSMAKARGSKQSFYDLVTMESDGIIEALGDSLAFDLYRDGNGILGRRLSASSNIITLYTSNDVRNFWEGMTVGASSSSDGSSARTGTTTVSSLSKSAGTVTLANAASIDSFANDDYIFRAGDNDGQCMEGLAALIPLTAPAASESFRGQDRSSNVEAYAGHRIDDSSTPIEENCGLLGVEIHMQGKRADVAFWNPLKFWDAVRRLGAKVEYDAGGTAKYGFQHITVATSAGVIKVYPDPDCPSNRQYVGRQRSFFIRHLEEKWVHVIRDDGRPAMREASADGIEIRTRALVQAICNIPGEWAVSSVG